MSQRTGPTSRDERGIAVDHGRRRRVLGAPGRAEEAQPGGLVAIDGLLVLAELARDHGGGGVAQDDVVAAHGRLRAVPERDEPLRMGGRCS